MIISVIHNDGAENEFELGICCGDCSFINWGWSHKQFNKFIEITKSCEPFVVPTSIDSSLAFREYIKNNF